MRRPALGIEKVEFALRTPILIAIGETRFSPKTSLASATAAHMLELGTI
jgi:hypothetical protein